MACQTSSLDLILARLDKLETANRRLKRGACIAAIGAGLVLLLASQEPARTKALKGDRFSLSDSNGRERAYLGMGAAGPVLRFLDDNGSERAGLEMGRDGMLLRLLDPNGKLQTGMSIEPLGVAIVSYGAGNRPHFAANALVNDGGALVPNRRP